MNSGGPSAARHPGASGASRLLLALGTLLATHPPATGAESRLLDGLRINPAASPAAAFSLEALRALPPGAQRARAGAWRQALARQPSRTSAETELLQVLALGLETRRAEFAAAAEPLAAALDDGKPWAPEGLRARRLVRVTGRLAAAPDDEKGAVLHELDELWGEALRGGPLAAAVLGVTLDALQETLGAVARSVPPADLAKRVNGWVAALVTVAPGDADLVRRAAQVHGQLGQVAGWAGHRQIAADQAARAAELDAALTGVPQPAGHDLLLAAQHRLWAGDRAGAARHFGRLATLPASGRFPGPAARVTEDWIRHGLLGLALAPAAGEAARRAPGDARSAVTGRPNLPELLFDPAAPGGTVAGIELGVLRVQYDARRPGAGREAVFLAQLAHTVALAFDLAQAGAPPLEPLLAAWAAGSREALSQAAREVATPLRRTAGDTWLGPTPAPRLAELVAAEHALMTWAAREPANGAREREAAQLVVDALHQALAAALAAQPPWRNRPAAAALGDALPALGIRPTLHTTMPVVPALFSASWADVQFEACVRWLEAMARESSLDVFKSVRPASEALPAIAVKLRPDRQAEVVAATQRFNARMAAVQEQAIAAARAAEERRRAEAARIAREAAESAARRQAAEAAARQAESARREAEAQSRWRWCMRCAGTGTYAQTSTEQNSYGRSERVQRQVRCDRCFGSGKLPY